MDIHVDGSEWQDQGWEQILLTLYDADIVFDLKHVRLPPNHSEEYTEIENISDDSIVLERTNLSKNQVRFELRHLEKENLVEFIKPFEDSDIVVTRLTASGFEIAHEKQRLQRDERWRRKSIFIDLALTFATILLAVNAAIQLSEQLSLEGGMGAPGIGSIALLIVLLLWGVRRRVVGQPR